MPNITGMIRAFSGATGAFESQTGSGTWGGSTTTITNNILNASRSSSIYGSSETVTPESLSTKFFIKF